jgi:hypothetical protein
MLRARAWQCNGSAEIFPVIPGRRAAANPESIALRRICSASVDSGLAGFRPRPE